MPKKDYTIIPVISIPTTAGTGSEITPYSTIWDMEEKKKYSLNIPELFPEIAIYDPSLTLTVPKDITIQTGLDALSHSLESIWNKNATPVTLSYAVKSAKLIINNLADLSNDLNNLSLRSNMMMACMYAGMAISNTQTAIAHAMSYHVTSHKGIPHGIACSFTLPMIIDSIVGKYEFIDNALIEIFNEPSSKKIRKLFKRLGVKVDMASYNMFEEDISRMLLTLDNNRSKNSMIKIKNLSFNF